MPTRVLSEAIETMAVSEIIGTLILVGVVVVGVALAGIFLLSNPAPSKVPVFDAIISNRSEQICIYHKGGDSLQAGIFQILVDGMDRTSSFANNGDEPWSVGETLCYTSPTMPHRVIIILNQSGGGGTTVITAADLMPAVSIPSQPPNAPSVEWSRSPAFGNLTKTFQFTDSSTGRNITTYSWDFGDGNTSTTRSPSHAFPCSTGESCSFNIGHSATDSNGTNWETTTWLNRSAYVTVYRNLTPAVSFTQDKTSGPAGSLTVTFTPSRAGVIKVDSWYWDFGDTGTSTSYSPSHTFTTEGIRTVTLTATNHTLGVTTVTKSNLITVTEPWYNCNWGYRKKITIDKSKVSGTLSNFPVLISLSSDTDLSARAQADGDDILFTSSDGTTKLSHEIESYSSGTLIAWVNVSLSSTTDTALLMYYGNSGALSQENPAGVWDSNYMAVWHHTDDFLDSTGNNNDPSAATATLDVGQIADCSYYSGSPYVAVPASATINNLFAGGGTFSAWIRPGSAGEGGEGRIAAKESNYIGGYGWAFSTSGDSTAGTMNITFRKGFTGTRGYWNTSPSSITVNTWKHVAVAYNNDSAGNIPIIYINGQSMPIWNSTVPTLIPRSDTSYNLRIGASPYGGRRDYVGRIDEIRASKTMRSDSWILTEYNNQNSPGVGGFIKSLATQESWTCGGGGPGPAFVQATADNSFSGNQNSVTLSSPSTAGNLLVVSFGYGDTSPTVTSVTDDKGNTYSAAVGATSWYGGSAKSATYYAYNTAGSVTSITVTLSGAVTWFDLWAAEYSGIMTSDPKDVTSVQTGSGTVMNSGSAATTQASELIYGYGHTVGSATVDSPFTARNTMNDNWIADHTVSSTGSYSASGTTTSADWVCMMVTFKGA